ncbi:uncharacterized protein [Macaca nemestrina]|uniref:uncharacterized protein isoform X6 n=1 Tax=Macaca nemestrina TaxID=9545 RepID=UPI0039B87EF1
MRRVALGALQGLSSRRRLRRCIGRLEVLGVLAPGRGRSRAGRRHAHHRAWRWNSNRACERALRYQLGDKIHGFTVNQDLQNLLSVYLDATFFPCLRELDFWVKSEEAPGTFSEGLGGRRTRWMKNKKEMHQHSLAGSVTHRTRMKTCTPAVRAFSLTGAPRAISTGHYVDASVTKWKASGPGGACSDQERPESKKHDTESHYVVQAALELLGSSDPPASAFQCTGMTSMNYRAGPTALKFHNHLETLTFHPPWWLPEVSSSSRAKGFLSFAARVRSLKMLPLLLKAFD